MNKEVATNTKINKLNTKVNSLENRILGASNMIEANQYNTDKENLNKIGRHCQKMPVSG